MQLKDYIAMQTKRIIYKNYIGRKTVHILEMECRYLLAKYQDNKKKSLFNNEFISQLRTPLKDLFIEMQLHLTNEVVLLIQKETGNGQLSKTLIGWLLSFILTQKMLASDISEEDQNATIETTSCFKSNLLISFLCDYNTFQHIENDGKKSVEFIYFEMSYPGFCNMPVCLETGLALYYFSNLHKPYSLANK